MFRLFGGLFWWVGIGRERWVWGGGWVFVCF